MKTLNQLYISRQRAEMRAHALEFRQSIHPESFRYESFSELANRGAFYLDMARSYRNRALTAAKEL